MAATIRWRAASGGEPMAASAATVSTLHEVGIGEGGGARRVQPRERRRVVVAAVVEIEIGARDVLAIRVGLVATTSVASPVGVGSAAIRFESLTSAASAVAGATRLRAGPSPEGSALAPTTMAIAKTATASA